MTETLYVPEGPQFAPTLLTASPWSQDHCHAGPPAALLTRAIQGLEPQDLDLSRITVEMLAPIPREPVLVAAQVTRPGRRVQLAEAELKTTEGDLLARAVAWRIRRRQPLDLPTPDEPIEPPPGPDGLEMETYRLRDYPNFYNDAQEVRLVAGSFARPGESTVWVRQTVPLLPGEPLSAEERTVAAADSGNGVSSVARFDELLFINPDLTVYLARRPQGEWIAMESRSHLDATGRGLTDTTLFDGHGYLGRANQSLFVDEP